MAIQLSLSNARGYADWPVDDHAAQVVLDGIIAEIEERFNTTEDSAKLRLLALQLWELFVRYDGQDDTKQSDYIDEKDRLYVDAGWNPQLRAVGAGVTVISPDPAPTATGLTPEQEAKLDGIEDRATRDQSAEEIRDDLAGLEGDERLSASALKDLPTGPGGPAVDVEARGAIGQEVHDRVAADNALTARLDREEAARESGDLALGNRIDAVRQYPSEDKSKLATIEQDATRDQSPEEIRDALDGLTGDDRLDARAIKNLPERGATDETARRQVIQETANRLAGDQALGQRIDDIREFPAADEAKLDGIEDNATADQTAEEIRDELSSLTGSARLDAEHIQGIEGIGLSDSRLPAILSAYIEPGVAQNDADDLAGTYTIHVSNANIFFGKTIWFDIEMNGNPLRARTLWSEAIGAANRASPGGDAATATIQFTIPSVSAESVITARQTPEVELRFYTTETGLTRFGILKLPIYIIPEYPALEGDGLTFRWVSKFGTEAAPGRGNSSTFDAPQPNEDVLVVILEDSQRDDIDPFWIPIRSIPDATAFSGGRSFHAARNANEVNFDIYRVAASNTFSWRVQQGNLKAAWYVAYTPSTTLSSEDSAQVALNTSAIEAEAAARAAEDQRLSSRITNLDIPDLPEPPPAQTQTKLYDLEIRPHPAFPRWKEVPVGGQADQVARDAINQVSRDLATETVSRQAGDEALSGKIDQQAEFRRQGDEALGQRIDALPTAEGLSNSRKPGLMELYVDPGVVERSATGLAGNYFLHFSNPNLFFGENVWFDIVIHGSPVLNRTSLAAALGSDSSASPGGDSQTATVPFTIPSGVPADAILNSINRLPSGSRRDMQVQVTFYTTAVGLTAFARVKVPVFTRPAYPVVPAPPAANQLLPTDGADGQFLGHNDGNPDWIGNVITGTGVTHIRKLTQAQYDALTTKVATVLYVIEG